MAKKNAAIKDAADDNDPGACYITDKRLLVPDSAGCALGLFWGRRRGKSKGKVGKSRREPISDHQLEWDFLDHSCEFIPSGNLHRTNWRTLPVQGQSL